MEDEVTLPPMEPSSLSASSFRRRRPSESSVDDNHGGDPSSDDPVFSSDDLSFASVDNYKPGAKSPTKRKRIYRGPWWGESSDSKRRRADLEQKELDSGVWLNGDDDVAVGSSTARRDGVVVKNKPSYLADPRSIYRAATRSTARNVFRPVNEPRSEGHRQAEMVIERCLEESEEVVDLTYIKLETIPSRILEPLHLLLRLPKFGGAPPSERCYSSFVPQLIIFLAWNGLSALPMELFKLRNLFDLSVRNNKLREIPPGIAKLKKLEVLNIAGNKLKHLPWELLELMKTGSLRRFLPHPNHYHTLRPSSDVRKWVFQNLSLADYGYLTPESDEEAILGSTAPILVAIGHVQFFDAEGNAVKESDAAPSLSVVPDESCLHATKVPSLRELSLRSFSRASFCSRVADSDLKGCPDHVLRLIRNAREVKESGGRTCTICLKDYIIPMVEWIEWWDCQPHENGLQRMRGHALRPLPFVRRGCSWFCVPDGDKLLLEMTKRRESEKTQCR